ncbi:MULTISPECIES: LuxR C-terminal-related transcriptional regulator [Brevibacterium]|uniref:DNA-binding HTH domain-containing proteins n=5 Tax=Bacteria TaxID=2 RepID=K9ADR2_9MICO|nr:LuxR C-terminal-related transcriptional regulator [Brevibacterium casei]NJE65659.1 response regulator transcription factor [Brevibacterium sp. LS14]SII21337.1 putative GAF sensor protein [Mycobacteroides abscessus subsp. abscessus]EKU45424.1 DNA-binding HTH domain-containing proteins [Brevibacterium casei S18]MCT1550343.1 LuxR C-terminal-related transcriptional regulator [Brevibacterium casei]MCT1560550.1 LuxR C-terminal-related transcriptional regulator [Brevibacterium casei]
MNVMAKEARALKSESRRLFAEAVDSLHANGTGDVVFGGMVEEGAVAVEAVAGASRDGLASLIVSTGRGLGGRALTEGTPQLTRDYEIDPFITHHYDEEVLGEGIQVLIAVPTLLGGEVTGMVYCGHRKAYAEAAPQTGDLVRRVRQLSVDLGRLGLRRPQPVTPVVEPLADLDSSSREALRRTFAELRAIRSDVADDATRERLTSIETRLADILSGHNPESAPEPTTSVSLSPRETDILSHVALGWSNARIAEALGLRESTVKSYLNTAMVKLTARTRHEAVSIARAAGILP